MLRHRTRIHASPTVRCVGGRRHVLDMTAVLDAQTPWATFVSTERRARPGGKAALLMYKVF